MSLPGLSIIGERINPGFASSKILLDNGDLEGIRDLARSQVRKGAVALNLNVGDRALREPESMAEVIRAVQDVVEVPLSFDFPNVEVQEVCLRAYDQERAGGKPPIVNSISELRWEMLDLLAIRPFRIILMASERNEGGQRVPNRTPEEVHRTAARMVGKVLERGDLVPDDLIIDVSVGPVAADTEGLTKMAVEGIRLIGADGDLQGIHMSVGLSNISIMLPAKAFDGKPLKSRVESAFLTLTVPHGLDMIIGTPGRKYESLPDDDPVLIGFREAMDLGGIEGVTRIQQLYREG